MTLGRCWGPLGPKLQKDSEMEVTRPASARYMQNSSKHRCSRTTVPPLRHSLHVPNYLERMANFCPDGPESKTVHFGMQTCRGPARTLSAVRKGLGHPDQADAWLAWDGQRTTQSLPYDAWDQRFRRRLEDTSSHCRLCDRQDSGNCATQWLLREYRCSFEAFPI